MSIQLLVDGEAATAAILNRPATEMLTQSAYAADGSDFAGFAKPANTIAGYGITDAYTKTASDARFAPTVHTHTVSQITDLQAVTTAATPSTIALRDASGNLAAVGLTATTVVTTSNATIGGSLLATTDNAQDIGASAANRFRNLFLAGAATVVGTINSKAVSGAVLSATAASSGELFSRFTNTFGNLIWGIEGSAGGAIFSGTAANSVVFGSASSKPIHFLNAGLLRVTIDATGNLIAGADNAYDIGASAANRFRNLFLAGSATIAGNITLGSGMFLFGNNDANGLKLGITGVGTGLTISNTLAVSIGGSLSVGSGLGVTGNSGFGGNVQTTLDNAYDIGASGASRFRDLFLSRDAHVAGQVIPSGTITSNVANGVVLSAPLGATNLLFGQFVNTFGSAIWGVENSTGGGIFTGTSAYSAVFGTVAAKAIHFVNAGAVRLTVDSSGNLIAGADNSFDIGASGTNRFRNLFLAGNATVGGTLTSTVGNNAKVLSNVSATTGWQVLELWNTSAHLYVGIEGSTGGTVLIGSNPYAVVLANLANNGLDFATNNTRRGGFSAAGAFDVVGSITAGGTNIALGPSANFGSISGLTVSAAAGTQRGMELQTAGVARWRIIADSTGETGTDAGSKLRISAVADTGAFIDDPISIVRAVNGAITLARPVSMTAGSLTVGVGVGAPGIIINGAAANNRSLSFQTNGVARWLIVTDVSTETGTGNTGSALQIMARDDTGVVIDSPITITRAATGGIQITRSLVAAFDNTQDIGLSATNRFRDLFLARNAVIGGTLTSATHTILGTYNGMVFDGGAVYKHQMGPSGFGQGYALGVNLVWSSSGVGGDPTTSVNTTYAVGPGVNNTGGLMFYIDSNSKQFKFLTAPTSTGAGLQATLTNMFQISAGSVISNANVFLNTAAGISRGLLIQTASVNRWNISTDGAAETGANAGSSLQVVSMDDAGATIDRPIFIPRALGGQISFASRPVAFLGSVFKVEFATANTSAPRIQSYASQPLYINELGNSVIIGSNVLALTDNTQDIGASAANRFRDLNLSRNATIGGQFTTTTVAGSGYVHNTAAGTNRLLSFQTAGSTRWQMGATSTAESGANAGSNWGWSAFDDTGTFIDQPLTIARATTGLITMGRSVQLSGLLGIGVAPVASQQLRLDGTLTASSGAAMRLVTSGQLAAAANNDTLRQIFLNGTHSAGVLTGVTAVGLDIGNVTGGATNYAIRTGTGPVLFGDTLTSGNHSIVGSSSNYILHDNGAVSQHQVGYAGWGSAYIIGANLRWTGLSADAASNATYAVAPGANSTGGWMQQMDTNSKVIRWWYAPASTGAGTTAVLTKVFQIALGSATLGDGTGTQALALDGAAAQTRDLVFRTNGLNRWLWRVSNDAESGSNAGSTLQLLARDDTGAFVDIPFSIGRAASATAQFSRTLNITGAWTVSAVGIFINQSMPAIAGFAYGINNRATISAAANNDVLTGSNISPTFTPGAFTGVSLVGLSIGNVAGGATNYAIKTGTGLVQLGDKLIAGTDNSFDIGASGANRFRDLFLGRNAAVGGTLGVGGLSATQYGVLVSGTLTGNADQRGVWVNTTFDSTATAGYGLYVRPQTAATAFTLTNARGIYIGDIIKGAGSAISSQVGLMIEAQSQGTTNSALYCNGSNDVVLAGGAAIATTATSGFTFISTCAGQPTGVPAQAAAGRVAMVYDTVNHKFWIYDAGWKGALLA